MWFAGGRQTLLHWDGATLQVRESQQNILAFTVLYNVASIGMYNDVHGSGPNDVWVVGTGGAVMHYDGAAWTPRPIAGADDLGTVLVVAPDDVWAADFWRDHLYRWDGQSWTEVEAPPVGFDINGNTAILALFGTSDDLWASGSGGNLFHWDGTSWSTVANFGVRVTSIDASADALWAVGSSQAVLRKVR